jgi:hypothetical protein
MNNNADLEVLMLAGMVNGQLNYVDKMMTERSNMAGPINKLNIPALVRGNKTVQNQMSVDPMVAKAYVSEDFVQSAVPDISIYSKTDNAAEQVVSSPVPQPNTSVPSIKNITTQVVDPSRIEQDIASIKNLLERINGSLTKMSGMMGKVFCSLNDKNKPSIDE